MGWGGAMAKTLMPGSARDDEAGPWHIRGEAVCYSCSAESKF